MNRIGFIYTSFDEGGSLGSYLDTLVRKLGEKNEFQPVILYSGSHINNPPIPSSVEFHQMENDNIIPDWNRYIQENYIDLVHLNGIPTFGQIPAFLSSCPVVATVHGTAHWINLPPDVIYSRKFRLRMRISDRFARSTIDGILAISPHVRDVLIDKAGYPPNKIKVAYEGVNQRFYSEDQYSQTTDIPENYIFHVSRYQKRKNVASLIRSLKFIPDERDIDLVIAGKGWQSHCNSLVEKEGLIQKVHFEGYVSQDRLIRLYDNGLCFALPSLHEGFGIPLVEAMARGTPVIASDRSAIPQITGEAAILIKNPHNLEEISMKLDRMISDSSLRSQLISLGKKRAKRFTWENHIQKVTSFYERYL